MQDTRYRPSRPRRVGVDMTMRGWCHSDPPLADHVASSAGVTTFLYEYFLALSPRYCHSRENGNPESGYPSPTTAKTMDPSVRRLNVQLPLSRKTLDSSGPRKESFYFPRGELRRGYRKGVRVLYILFGCPILNTVFYCAHGQTISYGNSYILLAWNTGFVRSPSTGFVFFIRVDHRGRFFISMTSLLSGCSL